jgi:hypothetical protein
MFNKIRTQGLLSVFLLGLILSLSSCGLGGEDSNESEYAYMVGDLMEGFEDALLAGGVVTFSPSISSSMQQPLVDSFLPTSFKINEAEPLATDCEDVALSSCGTGTGFGVQSRNYSNCSYNGLTFGGGVTFRHSGLDCVLSITESLDRTPNFTVTGRRGYSLYVYGTEPAQTITRTGALTYTFESNAITRSFADTEGTTVLEFSSEVSSPITITKSNSTTALTVTGGEIQISNLDGTDTCALEPHSVKWDSSGCRCPVSGYWSGNCTLGAAKVKFNGCGVADFTYDGETTTLNLDRCF